MNSIHAALTRRYCPPEWALFFEVGDATGGRQRRRADAVAMSCWPSRGLEIHGFEIKVDRRDWIKELRAPEKSAAVQVYCDRWWIVAAAGIVESGELPPTWGLLVHERGKLFQKNEAPKLKPKALTKDFVASLLRAASQRFVDRSAVEALAEEKAASRVASEVQRALLNAEHGRSNHERLERQWAELEEVVGKDIVFRLKSAGVRYRERFGMPAGEDTLGDAIRFVLSGGLEKQHEELERLRVGALSIADRVAGVIGKGAAE